MVYYSRVFFSLSPGTLISEALRCCAVKTGKKKVGSKQKKSQGGIPGSVGGVLGRCSPPLIQVLIIDGKAKLKWSEVPAVVLKGWTKTKPEMALSLVRAAGIPNLGVGRLLLKSRLWALSRPEAQKKTKAWVQASTLLFNALKFWNRTQTLDMLRMKNGTNGTTHGTEGPEVPKANETLLWAAVKGQDDEGVKKLIEVGDDAEQCRC